MTTPATIRAELARAVGAALDTWRESVFTGIGDLSDGAGTAGKVYAVMPAEAETVGAQPRIQNTGSLQIVSKFRIRLAHRRAVNDQITSMDALLDAVGVTLTTGLGGFDTEASRPMAGRIIYTQDATWIMAAIEVDVRHPVIP